MRVLTIALVAAAILLLPFTITAALQSKPAATQVIRYTPFIEVDAPINEQNVCV
jgi:hypothetical protein